MLPLEHCSSHSGWERQPRHRWPSRTSSRGHGVCVPSGLRTGTKAGEKEKQLLTGCFRHFPLCASASLQRRKVRIKDKKRSIILLGPLVRSWLAQHWEDCALLFIWLAHCLLFPIPPLFLVSRLPPACESPCRHHAGIFPRCLNTTKFLKSDRGYRIRGCMTLFCQFTREPAFTEH